VLTVNATNAEPTNRLQSGETVVVIGVGGGSAVRSHRAAS